MLLLERNVPFLGLKIIKHKIAQYYAFIILKPEWEARYEKFMFFSRGGSCINHIASHIKKAFKSSIVFRNIYCIRLKSQKLDHKNTSKRSFFKLLNRRVKLLEIQPLSNIIYIGLEWHIYLRVKINNLYTNLCLLRKNNLFFLLHFLSISRVIKYLAEFLGNLKINLRNIKCTLHRYVENFMHFLELDCCIKNGSCLLTPSKQSISNTFKQIKEKLYHKNKRGYLRNSRYISAIQAMSSVRLILLLWREYYSSILEKADLLKMNRVIDHMFYRWQVK